MAKSRVKIFPQKILSCRAIELLKNFVTRTNTLEFRYAFGDLIAEFEDNRTRTPEAKALFGLELLLHEADEGFRDIEEAYTYAQDLLEAERLADAAQLERSPNQNP